MRVVNTSGNKDAHLILRGGGGASNYDSVSVQEVEEALTKAKLPHSIVVDCSHGNSHKNHLLQVSVLHDIVMQKTTATSPSRASRSSPTSWKMVSKSLSWARRNC